MASNLNKKSKSSVYQPLSFYLNLPWSYTIEKCEEDGDSYYLMRINELPGCMTDGKTLEEAAEQIHEALEGYLLGMMDANNPIPTPVSREKFKGKIALRTSSDKHYRLAKVAQRYGKSVNKLIEEAIENYLASLD